MMLTEHDEPMPHLADKFDIEAMRANRDAGTPGHWDLDYTGGDTKLLAGRETLMCDMTYYPWCPDNQSDWLRIASVPSMEAQIERLTADLALAVEALEECQRDLDRYSQMEYSSDHPVDVRYRQRDYDGNPARIALASIKERDNG